jgi:hypothetical protein
MIYKLRKSAILEVMERTGASICGSNLHLLSPAALATTSESDG